MSVKEIAAHFDVTVAAIYAFADVGRSNRSVQDKFLYVAEFANGFLKIGYSDNPAARYAAHARCPWVKGAPIVRRFAVRCKGNTYAAEMELTRDCAAVALERFRMEWFKGLRFDDVCERAATLATRSPQEA